MPRKEKIVYCANCRHRQVDRGRGRTCTFCGCSPVPSYEYEPDSAFYPKPRITLRKIIDEAFLERERELNELRED